MLEDAVFYPILEEGRQVESSGAKSEIGQAREQIGAGAKSEYQHAASRRSRNSAAVCMWHVYHEETTRKVPPVPAPLARKPYSNPKTHVNEQKTHNQSLSNKH